MRGLPANAAGSVAKSPIVPSQHKARRTTAYPMAAEGDVRRLGATSLQQGVPTTANPTVAEGDVRRLGATSLHKPTTV